MSNRVPVYIVLLFSCACLALSAQVIRHAPTAAFPTIQGAVLASAEGDIVEVLPGIHVLPMPIDFGIKNITLRSTGGPDVTVLAGTNNKILMGGGQSTASLVSGFTLTGDVGLSFGGALLLIVASPIIHNCKFINNTRLDGDDAHGAAGAVYFAGPTFVGCLFQNNQCGQGPIEDVGNFYTNFGGFGGALFLANSTADFIDCNFVDNKAGKGGKGSPETAPDDAPGPGGFGGDGGAIYAENTDLSFSNCTFINNTAGDGGDGGDDTTGVTDGAAGPAGQGGAIRTFGGTLEIVNCLFSGNKTGVVPNTNSIPLIGGRGGALSSASSGTVISNSKFYSNGAEEGAGLNLDFNAGPATIGECIFADNQARGFGGAIHQRNPATLIVEHCNFVANAAFEGAAVSVDSTQTADIRISNSIIYPSFGSHFRSSPSATVAQEFTVSACNVLGGHPGAGNFDADPMWVNPFILDFHLLDGSPCIDAGDSSLTTSTADFDGETRNFGLTVDVGADEYFGIRGNFMGTLVDFNGDPEEVLLVDGATGTPGKVVHLAMSQPSVIEMRNPSLNGFPAQFIIFGTIGLPEPEDSFFIDFIGAPMLFTPYAVNPNSFALFLLADSVTQSPDALTPSTAAPWAVTVPAFGEPITFTMQALIQGANGQFEISNGLSVIVQ